MTLEFISSFSKGMLSGIVLSNPAEWLVHRDMLHAKSSARKKFRYIDAAARGHQDNHHGAYKGPAHYYRDITNENEVIHFSKGDVGLIAGVSSAVGSALASAFYLLPDEKNIEGGIGYATGFLSGVMSYYLAYEFSHHYMHVIGERRLAINRVLGDNLQGGREKRDGNLRLSKPLLDDICTDIEACVDNESSEIRSKDLFRRLGIQTNLNRYNINKTNLSGIASEEAIENTLKVIAEREYEIRKSLGVREKISHFIDRKIQSTLRESPAFQSLDNHHFVHHFKYRSNLNVVLPLTDVIARTKEDSSKKSLEEDQKLWLCPNSPDIKQFKRKERLTV